LKDTSIRISFDETNNHQANIEINWME